MDGRLLVVRKVDFDENVWVVGGPDPIVMALLILSLSVSIPNPPNEITWMTSPPNMVFSRLKRANAF